MLRTGDLLETGVAPAEDGVYLDGPIPPQQVLQENDLLLSRSGTIGRAYLVPLAAAGDTFAGFLVRFRPASGSDPRFLHYALRSKGAQDQIKAEAVTSTIQNFNADRYANLSMPNGSVEEQRRIADFLDTQVARIDHIIAARKQQATRLGQLLAHQMESVLDGMPDRTRASHLVRVLPGYAFPSDDYSTDANDIPLLRGINLGVGRLRWDDVTYWPRNRAHEVADFRLSAGEVVLGMDRPWIGGGLRIARVGPEDGEPLLLQRVAKIWSARLSSRYVYWAYQSQRFRRQVEADLTGLSVPHLSGDQILSYQIPFGSPEQQSQATRELDGFALSIKTQTQGLNDSVGVLHEYKQSLITAAVTGEFDVTTAGRGLPG